MTDRKRERERERDNIQAEIEKQNKRVRKCFAFYFTLFNWRSLLLLPQSKLHVAIKAAQ